MLNYNKKIFEIYFEFVENITEEDKKKIRNKLIINVRIKSIFIIIIITIIV